MSPLDVEEVIATIAGVRECAVIGVSDASGFLELVACVAATTGDTPPRDDERRELRARIDHLCGERLPRFKRPKRVVYVAALPRTPTGKLQRALLREKIR